MQFKRSAEVRDVQERSLLTSGKQDGLASKAVISAEVHILGCLKTDSEVEIEGRIEGDVRCKHLTVGESGAVIGDITAEEVVVRGKVKGVIRASRVLVLRGAHVESEICHAKLSIEEGSYFKGTSAPNDSEEINVSSITAVAITGVLFEVAEQTRA